MLGGPWIECEPARPNHPGIDSGLRLIAAGLCDYLGHGCDHDGADYFGGPALLAVTRGLGSEPDMHVATFQWGDDGFGWYCASTGRLMLGRHGTVEAAREWVDAI